MTKGSEFVDFVLESLEPLRGVSARRMFGGHGIYKDGLMFALIAGDQLYLKADGDNRPAFKAQGLEPFTYTGKGRPVQTSYYEAPGEGLDDPEILCEWARGAYAAALRARKPTRR
jgi:DNA transformation protein